MDEERNPGDKVNWKVVGPIVGGAVLSLWLTKFIRVIAINQPFQLLPLWWSLCWWSEVFAWPREDTEGCPSPSCRKSVIGNISCPMFVKKLIIHTLNTSRANLTVNGK